MGPIANEVMHGSGKDRGVTPEMDLQSAEQAADLVRELLEYHFNKGRRVSVIVGRECIPQPRRLGDFGTRHEKGDLTIFIRAEVPRTNGGN